MPQKVMIVDDSAMIRMQVSRALKDTGCVVEQANDGQEAWEKLEAAEDAAALMICDVNMPRMNGIELLEQMHGNQKYRETAILMLTTEGQPDLIRRAKELGARGWLVKPLRPELLVAAFDALASKKSSE